MSADDSETPELRTTGSVTWRLFEIRRGQRLPALLRTLGRRLWPVAPWSLATAALAWAATRAVLDGTGGEAGVPLDDAYIHFQYARAFASGHPFVYTPDAAPTPGATSLLWPLLLAPFVISGLSETAVIWAAWTFGWIALAALAYETARLAGGLCASLSSVAAGALVLAFGGYTWFAASGMEVVPFAWLLARAARRASEWAEEGDTARRRAHFAELVALAWLCPLMRPEGVIASLLMALALLVAPYRNRRWWCSAALAAVLAPTAVYLAATGAPMSTTATAKWLPLNPYYRGDALAAAVSHNVELLFVTLLDGQLWTSVFLPSGGRVVAWLALPAFVWAGIGTRRFARAGFVLLIALGALLPTTYETFLVNRVRYLWPFAFAWFIGIAIVGEAIGSALARLSPRLGEARLLFNGAMVGLLASCIGASQDDLAASAQAITRQQVALGKWIHEKLPPTSLVAVNDAGAIAYFGHRRTFDIVGLTTRGEARYWTAGPGSRFEHYERLAPGSRPTHFVVYPEWFAIDVLLGERLAERTVLSTILGGPTMVAHRARYDVLGSGAQPSFRTSKGAMLDELDVADLESEAAHDYELLGATQRQNVVVERGQYADGARSERAHERFELDVGPSAILVARYGSESQARVAVSVGGTNAGELEIVADSWSEVQLRLPPSIRKGRHTIEIRAIGNGRFTSMHYWVY